MNKAVKKLAALFLALAMILTLLPGAAFAQGDGDAPAFDGTMYILTGPDLDESDPSGFSTMQNSSFGLRFKTADGTAVAGEKLTLAGVVFGDGSETVPENTITVSPAADYINVVVSAGAPVGTYALTFLVEGAAAVLNLPVAENGGGGTGPVPGPPVVEYRRAASESPDFQPAPTDGSPLSIQKGEAIFLRVTQDGEPLEVTAALTANGGQVKLEALDGKVVKVTGGDANGSVNVLFNFATGNLTQPLFVTGNTTGPEGPSDYASAQVRQTFANSGKVTFAEVSGEAEDVLPEGFSLKDGVLSFDTAGKQPGLYETVVGGRTYAVAVMNPLPAENDFVVTVQTTDYQPGSLPVQGKADGFYYCNGVSEGAEAKQLVFQPGDRADSLHPIYVYQVKNGRLCDIVGSSCSGMAGDIYRYFRVQTIEWQVDGGTVKVLKLSPADNVPMGATLVMNLSILDENMNFLATMEVAKANLHGCDSFGFTENYAAVGSDDRAALSYINLNVPVGAAPSQHDFYLTKGSGDNGSGQYAQYDFALYDDVEISTLTVTSSDLSLATVEQYLEKTPDGENAIGLRVKVADTSTPRIAELTVQFTDKVGTQHTYRGAVFCYEPPHYDSVTVDNEAGFQAAYNSMTEGTIYLKSGTYSMDIFHNKNIAIKAAEGAQVVINGENATNDSAILTIGTVNPAEISGITIDGRGLRDGIDPNGNNCYVSNMTVRNCAVGVRGAGTYAIYATDSRFLNNGLAIQGTAGALQVNRCAFEENTVAVDFSASVYVHCRVQMNRFSGNGADFRVSTDYNGAAATQNYYEQGGRGTKPVITAAPGKTGKVYYSPWFADEAMTLYTADLAGAKTGAARTAGYTVPVDRTLSDASLLDSALFAEMKGQPETTVSIPVTETVGDKALVTTVWGFDSGKLAEKLPDTMDLEVTDTLSAKAQAVVDKVVENPEAIAQAVNFSHDGALPGTATVMVRKTGDIKADELKLYYINETTGTVEQAEIVAVSETTLDGVDYYVVTVAHCSEYLIAGAITLKEEGGSTGGSEGDNTGSTGGESTPTPTAAPTAAPAATPAPTQVPASANKLVSALEVEERFAGAQSNEVAFDVARKPLVSAGAFGILAQNPDKALVLEGEGYAWRFEGAALTDPGAIEGASFDTTVSLTSPNAHLIAPLVKDVPAVNVYFSYHGALPGPAQVSVQLGAEHAGSVKYLYYFNSTAVTLEYVGEAKVDASGVATFTIEHCSDYVLLDEKLEETDAPAATPGPEATAAPEATQAPAAQETGAPSGGSTGFILAAVAAAAALAAVILLLVRRRKGE